MLFNSYEFLFAFFPLVLLGFFVLGRRRHELAAGFLALASVFFYGWWSAQALPLLLGSIVFNYLLGQRVAPGAARSEGLRKRWLQFALAVNLALLGVFKYADFFIANVNQGLQALALPPWPALHWVLPIGISFYTFTQIAYLVDSWQGKVRETRFVHYLLFVTYFPHLIAGPVLHHAQMMPQFARARTYRLHPRRLVLGLGLFVLGLSKKLLIADPLGQCADLIFDRVHTAGVVPSLELAWTGVLAYTFQIYFDFSGYSDMAIGISRCLGVRLPENFRSPYKAGSIIEFWRRWHISLSNFLRDYLYIPLGGNRHGQARRLTNLMITMLLGGLWHGAAWTFVLWGAIHGAALVVNHLWRGARARLGLRRETVPGGSVGRRMAGMLGWAGTFIVVCIAWVVFRAPDMETALQFYRGMAGLQGTSGPSLNDLHPPFQLHVFYRTLVVAMLVAFALPRGRQWVAVMLPLPRAVGRWARQAPAWSRGALAAGAGVAAGLLSAWNVSRLGVHSPFLYFQF